MSAPRVDPASVASIAGALATLDADQAATILERAIDAITVEMMRKGWDEETALRTSLHFGRAVLAEWQSYRRGTVH